MILFRNNIKGTKKRIRSKRYQMIEKAVMSPIKARRHPPSRRAYTTLLPSPPHLPTLAPRRTTTLLLHIFRLVRRAACERSARRPTSSPT